MAQESTIKIAATGSIRWEDKRKIKDVLFDLKRRLGNRLEIISGGIEGADLLIRKCTMELDMDYKEIPPPDGKWSHYCLEPPFMFGKPHKSNHIYMRNIKLEKECEILILFRLKEDDAHFLDDLINRFHKKSKKIVVIN